MNFEYQSVGNTNAKIKRVPLLHLATNIVTDWMPGVPNSLARGFVDLLGNVIKAEPVLRSHRDGWVVQKSVAGFEKQWKQMTSWMLGVAFCRFVAELEGYRWWSPVSAFTAAKHKTKVASDYWTKYLKIADCRVQMPSPVLSNLFPDYVLARRRKSKSLPEISFAESKGSDKAIKNLVVPPSAWSDQSKNAEFVYQGVAMPIVQHLLVATRVNPGAEKPRTRKIRVRAWNSREPENRVSVDAFRAVLAAHYIGVCERLDLPLNAELIALGCLLDALESAGEDLFRQRQFQSELHSIDFLRGNRAELGEAARGELRIRASRRNPNLIIFDNPNRASFIVGERAMQTGISPLAMNIIGWLQGRGDFDFDELEESPETNFREEEPDFIVRGDGVISEWL